MLARLAVVLTVTVTFRLGMLAGLLLGPGLGAVILLGAGAVVLAGMLIARIG